MLPYYYSLNEYLQKEYGCKMYKLALDGGMTCPNRDGRIDTRGCIFCSEGGSGDFAASDIEEAKKRVSGKYEGNDYIAYYQSFSNTYASVEYLRQLYMPVIMRDDIRILSIATRPDCITHGNVELLSELNRIKPVWVELGLQTVNEKTAAYIRRGYKLDVYDAAVRMLTEAGIRVIVHQIIGLPMENMDDYRATTRYIAQSGAFGIKLQLLHILRGTDLEKDYRRGLFKALDMGEYIYTVGELLKIMPEDLVIHRLTGDGPKAILIAPQWSGDKKRVLNTLNGYLRDNNITQGMEC